MLPTFVTRDYPTFEILVLIRRTLELEHFVGTIEGKIQFLKAKVALVELRFHEVCNLENELRKEQVRSSNLHKRLTVAESELRQIRRLLEQQRK
jgi:hypothetical protein